MSVSVPGLSRVDHSVLKFVHGVLLCASLTVVAAILDLIEVQVLKQPYLEALVLAIILGVAVRSVCSPGSLLRFTTRFYFLLTS